MNRLSVLTCTRWRAIPARQPPTSRRKRRGVNFLSAGATDYATHLVDIVTHIDSHGFGGPGKLHTLLYFSPATQYVPQLRKDILEIDQPDELTAFLKKFPGSSGKTYAQIKDTLSELYDATHTEPSAAK